MSAADLLRDVVRALDGASIPHMLVGSFASSSYGALRATQDVDIVIDPTAEALDRFVAAFDDGVEGRSDHPEGTALQPQ